jgi:hypothetical protein
MQLHLDASGKYLFADVILILGIVTLYGYGQCGQHIGCL